MLLVMAHHSGLPFSSGGFLGVDGFFVLSGFLITTLLVEEWHREGKISLRSFYIRRALRLFPALLVLLLVCSLLTLLLMKGDVAAGSWRGIFLASFYASDWATVIFGNDSSGLGIVQHTWSLGVEEQFYLLWPLLLIFMFSLRMRTRSMLFVVVLLIVASAVWRALLIEQGQWVERVYKEFDTRADALLIGCYLGLVLSLGVVKPSPRMARFTRPLLVVVLPLLAYLCFTASYFWTQAWGPDPRFLYYGGFTLVALLVATLILHLMVSPEGKLSRALAWGPLTKIGLVSYGLYLWHYPVFSIITPGPQGWLDWPVQLMRLVVTFTVVLISYRYVELPMLELKRKLQHSRDKDTPTPLAAVALDSS